MKYIIDFMLLTINHVEATMHQEEQPRKYSNHGNIDLQSIRTLNRMCHIVMTARGWVNPQKKMKCLFNLKYHQIHSINGDLTLWDQLSQHPTKRNISWYVHNTPPNGQKLKLLLKLMKIVWQNSFQNKYSPDLGSSQNLSLIKEHISNPTSLRNY